ncbi:hypothetical protein F5Y03DRAFT_269247 [Xylaria venustula]|nr:hypothetical protein F5Y03DRAFT_269247 [Xylaria venustula]
MSCGGLLLDTARTCEHSAALARYGPVREDLSFGFMCAVGVRWGSCGRWFEICNEYCVFLLPISLVFLSFFLPFSYRLLERAVWAIVEVIAGVARMLTELVQTYQSIHFQPSCT